MIAGFSCRKTHALFLGNEVRKWSHEVQRAAHRKLLMIDAATSIADLRVPLSNRLHPLKGNWSGYHSISVNKQWRIVFIWTTDNNATHVQLIDYHS